PGREHRVGGGAGRVPRPGELRGGEGRGDRHDPGAGEGAGPPRHHRQRGRPRGDPGGDARRGEGGGEGRAPQAARRRPAGPAGRPTPETAADRGVRGAERVPARPVDPRRRPGYRGAVVSSRAGGTPPMPALFAADSWSAASFEMSLLAAAAFGLLGVLLL